MSEQYKNIWIVTDLPESEVLPLLKEHKYQWTPWYSCSFSDLSCCFITQVPERVPVTALNLSLPYILYTGTLGSYAGANLLNESGHLTLRGNRSNQGLQRIDWEAQRERWKVYKLNKLLGL